MTGRGISPRRESSAGEPLRVPDLSSLLPEPPPRVCVIVLNWNGRRHIEYSLPSLLATAYPAFELWVVDNASTDGSAEFISERFPRVRLLRTPRNLDFAGGNNYGVRAALADGFPFVALVNNDVRADARWLDGAVRVAAANPRVAMTGFRVFGGSRREPQGAFEGASLAFRCLEARPAPYIVGCALFIRAAALREVGLLDEAYFMYEEENDLELRAQRKGWLLAEINVPFWHFGEGSRTAWGDLRASWYQHRNILRCALKNRPPKEIARLLAFVLWHGCNPFRRPDREVALYRRLRPRGVLWSWAILAGAVGWNLAHLRQTWRERTRGRAAPFLDPGFDPGEG
ncbi:MAG: glycosyltransferase family 2 protein [Nitrospinota bacterium]